MTSNKIKDLILQFTDDVVFFYHGKSGCINPWNEHKFEVGFGNIGKEYDSIDALMSDPIYDGFSLNQIADKIELA
ncbi:hypothetical protein [Clostridium minihomine]|uniref:hypothetical protein n=1 Tax=Clostridium minihomine TaxID=2045012 RepID=UPI000C78303B|nr:hypothetical protein [Clostridium minihomine]